MKYEVGDYIYSEYKPYWCFIFKITSIDSLFTYGILLKSDFKFGDNKKIGEKESFSNDAPIVEYIKIVSKNLDDIMVYLL